MPQPKDDHDVPLSRQIARLEDSEDPAVLERLERIQRLATRAGAKCSQAPMQWAAAQEYARRHRT